MLKSYKSDLRTIIVNVLNSYRCLCDIGEEKLTRKIFKSIMLVSGVIMALGLAFVLGILYKYFGNQIGAELDKEASYLSVGVEQSGVDYLYSFDADDSRITYIDPEGNVLYDNKADISSMENHSDREEIVRAIKYGKGSSVRLSGTLSEKTVYHARRLQDGSVLRVSSTQYSVLALVGQMILPMCWILLFMMILSGIFSARISKKIVDPVNNLDLEHPEDNEIYEEVEPLLSRIYKQKREICGQLEAARQQQEEFSVITENMQEGLIVIDRHTMLLSANTSAWKMFKTEKERLGESVYCLNRSEEFLKVIGNVLQGEHQDVILKLDGSDVQMIANPVFRDGTAQGAVLLLVNVTEMLERENLRREFSANVSHELKTPLTSISGYAEIIQKGFVQKDDIPKFAGRIYEETQHLIQLVEDIIKISRLDESEVSYEWEDVDVYQISRNVVHKLEDRAKLLQVHFFISGDKLMLHTVRTLLEEILYNLCDNGMKYNRRDGSVSIYLKEEDEKVVIVVKDTGIGIPKEDQNRVFERFYRVDKSHSREIDGTGLGLSIVKHAVNVLHGSVSLKSETGTGTEITVELPKEISF